MGDTRLDFLTRQPVAGEPLPERLERGALSPDQAIRCAIEIGSALQKIHSKGLVHGGLTPQCIVLGDKGAQILEPGNSPLERAAYRAPEQLRGEEADVRCDIFSYGAVLYELATGARAFQGTGPELNDAILNYSPPPLEPPMPAVLDEVIAGCMAKDPAQRRQRVQNAVIELKLAGGRGGARSGEPVRRAVERPKPAPPAPARGSARRVRPLPSPPPEPPPPAPPKPPVLRPPASCGAPAHRASLRRAGTRHDLRHHPDQAGVDRWAARCWRWRPLRWPGCCS